MSELLPDTVRRDQLEIALCAATEALSLLFNTVPPVTDRSPSAQAARMAILQVLLARCRKAGIGVELVETGTHQRASKSRGHTFVAVNRVAIAEPEVPVDPYPRPLNLINATALDSASLRDLVELAGECIARIEHAAGGPA